MSERILWRWAELCEAVGAPTVAGPDVAGVSIDTRTLQAGDLFVALLGDPGPRFHTDSRSDRDGHDHVAAAAGRGAAGALVHRDVPGSLPQIRVADTLDGLWDLGRAARRRLGGAVFAVTGSSGKTTVKTFLGAALGCPAASGSLNNFWGVPLSLARTPGGTGAAVYEIGTNHPGEIAPLSALVRPTVALVLNVLPVHVEFFADLAALRAEKLSIARGLGDGATLVVHDALAEAVPAADARRLRVLTFGDTDAADLRLSAYDPASRTARFHWRAQSGPVDVTAPVPGGGRHRAMSLAATMACLLAAGEDPARAAALDDTLIPAGRGRIVVAGGVTVIDDSYNANPASMAAALAELGAARGTGRSYAILGEMRELGADAERYHRALEGPARAADGIFCVGPGMRALHDALPPGRRRGYVDSAGEIDLALLAAQLAPGDRVLIKGSNRVFWTQHFAARLIDALTASE